MFEYIENNRFARRNGKPENYICYRTVICHALFEQYQKNPDGISDTIEGLYNAYQNDTSFDSDTLLIYPVSMSDKTGYLLVDKTRGCFPLIFYPFKVNPDNPSITSRKNALGAVLNDLKNNVDKISLKFNSHNQWSNELQNDLQNNCFNYGDDS